MKRTHKRDVAMSADSRYALNAICPYFTMFPLEYPMRVLDPPTPGAWLEGCG